MRQGACLVVVCAAAGTGKTELVPHLVTCAWPSVVLEMDEVPTDGRIMGIPVVGPENEENWSDYENLWMRIVHLIARTGHTVILITQLPDLSLPLPAATQEGLPIQWVLLSCAPEQLSARLEQRNWPRDRIDEVVAAAIKARQIFAHKLEVPSSETPAGTADRLMKLIAGPMQ